MNVTAKDIALNGIVRKLPKSAILCRLALADGHEYAAFKPHLSPYKILIPEHLIFIKPL
jgi:hypothetical protein